MKFKRKTDKYIIAVTIIKVCKQKIENREIYKKKKKTQKTMCKNIHDVKYALPLKILRAKLFSHIFFIEIQAVK